MQLAIRLAGLALVVVCGYAVYHWAQEMPTAADYVVARHYLRIAFAGLLLLAGLWLVAGAASLGSRSR